MRHALETDDVLGFGLAQSSTWGSQRIDKATQDYSWPAAVAKSQIELVTSRRKRDGSISERRLLAVPLCVCVILSIPRVWEQSKQKLCPAIKWPVKRQFFSSLTIRRYTMFKNKKNTKK